MSKNLDLARECEAIFTDSVDLIVFTPDKLDAFAERIRAEKADAPGPSGERAALRQRLGEALTEVLTDDNAAPEPDWFDAREIDRVIDAMLPAISADMLAADAPEQEPVANLEFAKECVEIANALRSEYGVISRQRNGAVLVDFAKHPYIGRAGALLHKASSLATPPAPQTRELNDEQIMDVSGEFVRDALGKTNLLRFARAVLAARSEP